MGFMNTDIVNGRRNERKRCNEAAMRTKRPLRVGYINAIRYWGAPVPKTDLASNRVHVSVPRAQDRNHIAGVTFHVFSGKEEYCKYEYERFWMASPAMAWAQMATYCDTEALATIASVCQPRGTQEEGQERRLRRISRRESPFRGEEKMRGGAPVHRRGHGFTTRNTSVRHSLGFGARQAVCELPSEA